MVSIGKERFCNLEEVELRFFKEFKELSGNERLDRNLYDSLNGIFEYGYFFKVIFKTDDKIISVDESNTFYVFNDNPDFEIGDIFTSSDDDKDILIKLDKEVLDNAFLKNQAQRIDSLFEKLKPKEVNVINKDFIRNGIDELIKKQKEEDKKKEREENTRVRIEDGEEADKRKKYEEESKVELEVIKVDEKKIELNNEVLELNDNANNTFSFEEIEKFDRRYYSGNLHPLIEDLLNKKVSFKWERGGYSCDIEFSKDNLKLNGVKIRNSKLNFLLARLDKNTTKEQIKLLNKLSGVKVDLLNLKRIVFREIEIPIEFNLISDDLFKIKLFSQERNLNWNDLKEDFFYGGTSRSLHSHFGITDFFKLTNKMGLEKQEVLSKLRDLFLLNSLEMKDDS